MLTKVKAILADPGGRDEFFYRVGQIFPTRDPGYKLIKRAYDINKDAFRGMAREDETRSFEHLRGVALLQMDYLFIRDPQTIATGLMHDLPEDKSEWPIDRIEEELQPFACCFDRWHLPLDLEYIKKPSLKEYGTKEMCLQVYHDHLDIAPREVHLSKEPDRLFNVLTLGACSVEKRRRKIEETERIYLPWARRHLILAHEIEAAVAEIKLGLAV